MAGVAHLGFVAVGDEVDRLRVEVVGVLVHQLRGDRRRRTLREVCVPPLHIRRRFRGSFSSCPLPRHGCGSGCGGVRTELRDEGEEEHNAVAVRRQPRLHRMACAQPTPTDQIRRLTRFEINSFMALGSVELRMCVKATELTHAERHDDAVPSFGRDLHEAELLPGVLLHRAREGVAAEVVPDLGRRAVCRGAAPLLLATSQHPRHTESFTSVFDFETCLLNSNATMMC